MKARWTSTKYVSFALKLRRRSGPFRSELRGLFVATYRDIEGRVERLIAECGRLGVKPTPEAVARIMVEQELLGGIGPAEAKSAYDEYVKAATRALAGTGPGVEAA
jgi:hypothetical protein